MGDLLRIDFAARRRVADSAPPCADQAGSAAGGQSYLCPKCRGAQSHQGICDGCAADIEREHYEMLRFQQHRRLRELIDRINHERSRP